MKWGILNEQDLKGFCGKDRLVKYYQPVYLTEGIPKWWWLLNRKRVQSIFMDMRNEAVRLVNPNFDKWNKEYDETFGQGRVDEHYDCFISEKQNSILNVKHDGITMKASPKLQGDLCGTIDRFPDSLVWVEFKPYYGRI